MKKFDIKDVFTWSNAEDAKQYIGKECYFADRLEDLKNDVDRDIKYILQDVSNQEQDFIHSVFCDSDLDRWGMCLPAEKVKEVEEPKQYRPFKNADEFRDYLGFNFIVNLSIKIEEKITSERYELAIIGFFTNGLVLPIYCDLTFEELFSKFNICIDGKWQPFGVEE